MIVKSDGTLYTTNSITIHYVPNGKSREDRVGAGGQSRVPWGKENFSPAEVSKHATKNCSLLKQGIFTHADASWGRERRHMSVA